MSGEGFLLQFGERMQRGDAKTGIGAGRLSCGEPVRLNEQDGQSDK
jgi:hypothetical protein